MNLLPLQVTKTTIWGFIFSFLIMFTSFAVIPYISTYMVKNVGLTEKQLPLIFLFGGIFSIISSPLAGKLSDKFGKPKIFIIMNLISIIPVLLLTNLYSVPLPAVLCITTLFMISNNMHGASYGINYFVCPHQ